MTESLSLEAMSGPEAPRVTHLTSVHSPFDNRIFHKELRSLRGNGFDVVIIAPHSRDEIVDGISIWAEPKPRFRLERMIRTTRRIYKRALSSKARIFHFHDSELIVAALLLRLHGAHVVYDVHENLVTSIKEKEYIPAILRPALSLAGGGLENSLSRFFTLVIAERCYSARFPGATEILNYPVHELFEMQPRPDGASPPRLLFTGESRVDRGAIIHGSLVHALPGLEVHLVGRCTSRLAKRLEELARPHEKRLRIVGRDRLIPYPDILNTYARGGWTAGLALFPPNPNNSDKEPTKLFEYMAAGIPIICSDFPAWRDLLARTNAGICVNPSSAAEMTEAVLHLVNHPDEARAMGINGRRAVETKLNWRTQEKKLLKLYRTLLSRDPRS